MDFKLALKVSSDRLILTISSARLTFGTPITPFSSAKGESGEKAGTKGVSLGIICVTTPAASPLPTVCAEDVVVTALYGAWPPSSREPTVCRLAILAALAFSLYVLDVRPLNAMDMALVILLGYHEKG